MITQIEVTTPQGNVMTLALDDPVSPFVVEDIQGLDPVKASLVSSGFANLDGAQYQTSRRETRNITMRIGFNYDPMSIGVLPRDLRDQLYRFFMPKSQVKLLFWRGAGPTDAVEISGRVESFVSPLFTREPKVDISIICFDPDFTDYSPALASGTTVSTTAEVVYDYQGTIETGFVFDLNVNRSLSSFTIYNRMPDNTLQVLEIASSLISGDVVTISTVQGNKSVIRTRSGVATSILYAMSPQSAWIEFFPGENNFRVYAAGAAIPYDLTYTARYGGL
jgi:hypothetical protein